MIYASDFSRPIHFPHWARVLASELPQPEALEERRRQIIGFLSYCRRSRAAASIASCRAYLEWLDSTAPGRSASAREALRWFVRAGRRQGDHMDQGSGIAVRSAAMA